MFSGGWAGAIVRYLFFCWFLISWVMEGVLPPMEGLVGSVPVTVSKKTLVVDEVGAGRKA